MEFKEIFAKILETNSLSDYNTPEFADKFEKFCEILLEYNKKVNLTAIKSVDGTVLLHFADSLTVASAIPEGASLIDVGCGAGFPSLPLAICRPDIRIFSLDSTSKKIDFVKFAASELDLGNITAFSGRAEELAAGYMRESFDFATGRAVSSLNILSELCLPFVRVGGRFCSMKGSKTPEELSEARSAIFKCGGVYENTRNLALKNPFSGEIFERNLVFVKKTTQTAKRLPRAYAQIVKKPL